MKPFLLLVATLFALTACSDDAEVVETDEVTETRMDDVDVIDGTISDDMVDIDTQTDTDLAADGDELDGADDATDEADETAE